MTPPGAADPNQLLRQAFAHHQAGRLNDAEALYRALLAQVPTHSDALHLLGLIRMEAGAYPEALALIGAAHRQAPRHPILLNNLGECQRRTGDLTAARDLLEQALRVRPDYPEAHHNLGKILAAQGDAPAAEGAFRRALTGMPGAAPIWLDLADTLQRLRRPDEALDAYRRAFAAAPESITAANLLAMTLKNCGRVAEACALYESVLARMPDPLLASNYLLTSCYLPDLPPAELRQRHEQWARQLWTAGGGHAAREVERRPSGEFPARPAIGFVSGDFRVHAMRFFIDPLLAGLRKCGVRLVGYHTHGKTDVGTDELRPLFDEFRQVDALDDEALAAVIRSDGVDVLVDLSGHTGYHRLGVFARRPAPLQVSWIGYLATTGLAAFDAHLTDRLALPAHAQDWFSEPLAYLPHCQWCYRLPELPELPEVDHSQHAAGGDIVFGGFHMPTKLNPAVLDAWAELLRRCPAASLVLMGDDLHDVRQQLEARLAAHDAGDRLRCLPAGSLREYLRAHEQVDLMLDAFPYSGGTTTFHALAMGVPVLTCAVEHPAGRGGASILSGVGLSQFIAGSVAEYIEMAAGWAGRVSELRAMRGQVRAQLASSPLADGDRFAADFLQVLAGIWRDRQALPAD